MRNKSISGLSRPIIVVLLLIALSIGGYILLRGTKQNPNIVLIIVDTLGGRHVSPFSPETNTASTPNIDQLGRQGVVFKNAYSPSSWTKPSISSIFTGLMPASHTVRSMKAQLPESIPALAEILKREGYATGGMVSHTLLSPKTSYARGFDRYKIAKFPGKVQDSITASQVTDFGVNWVEENKSNGPFFLFLHYFDPHYNYQHHKSYDRTSSYQGRLVPGLGFREYRDQIPELSESDVDFMVGLHHEEISHTDDEIGRLVEVIKKDGLERDTLIVFVADHGEEFLEHGGVGHGRTLYNEVTHVPLIFTKIGSIEPKVINTPVSSLDITPTILDLLSLKVSGFEPQGVSLMPLLKGGDIKDRILVSEVDFRSSGIKAFKVSALRGNLKVIFDKPTETFEYFDLSNDPLEKIGLKEGDRAGFGELKTEVLRYIKEDQRGGGTEEDHPDASEGKTPEEVEQLKSLGYL